MFNPELEAAVQDFSAVMLSLSEKDLEWTVQHTVQIDTTLAAIGQAPSESKRLLHRIYAARAEAKGMMIRTEKTDDAAILATASSISNRANEIRKLLVT